MPNATFVPLPAPAETIDAGELRSLLAAEVAERLRVQSELDLRNCALDAATSYLMIIDVSGSRWKILYANRACARDHGYEIWELQGQSPALLLATDENVATLEEISAAARAGASIKSELTARRKDGSRFRVGMFMAPIRSAVGNVTHYVGIGADITAKLEQERLERELRNQLLCEMRERERMAIELRLAQKLESVGRLAAGIAHEINTPIQYIGDSVIFLQSAQQELTRMLQAYSGALEQLSAAGPLHSVLAEVKEAHRDLDLDFLATEIPKAFERTLQGVERVAAIVGAMKEFAHPDTAEHCSADLNHAIETTITVAHNEYKYSATLETQFGDLPQIVCNVGEVNQVVLNLIVNAAHAIVESGKDVSSGRITIATSTADDAVEIRVVDNGCGIPASDLDRVFDPFFTTKPVGRGTGQGLAIARAIIVERHGGTIDVHSTVGVGSCFILRLPVASRSTIESK